MLAVSLDLRNHTSRSLCLLASHIAGRPIHVATAARLNACAAVLYEHTTILVNPDVAGLYDVVVCAELLKNTSDEAARYAPLANVPEETTRVWLRDARRSLHARFPAAPRWFRGALREPSRDLPWCGWSDAPFAEAASTSGPPCKWVQIHGVSEEQSDREFARLKETIEAGIYPLEHPPALRELPVARVEYEFACEPELPEEWTPLGSPPSSRLEQQTRAFMRCIVRRTLNDRLQRRSWIHTRSGGMLDGSRLVDAQIASSLGEDARVFQRRFFDVDETFRPEQTVSIVSVHLSSISVYPRRNAHMASRRILLAICEAYRRLGMPLGILAFADQILPLSDSQYVYLHIPIIVKSPQEPFRRHAWARLISLFDHMPLAPDAHPAEFPPFSLEATYDMAREAAASQDVRHYVINYTALNGMPPLDAFPTFFTGPFQSRMAAEMDRVTERFMRDTASHTGFAAVQGRAFLPIVSTAFLKKGGALHRLAKP